MFVNRHSISTAQLYSLEYFDMSMLFYINRTTSMRERNITANTLIVSWYV